MFNFKTNIQMPKAKQHGKSLDSLRFNSIINQDEALTQNTNHRNIISQQQT
jgi:hypothetical protein